MKILSAVQVVNSLLSLSEAYNVPITNLSLQKLLFFIQGFHYLNYDKLLFEEEIEACNFGPVIPEIYHQFKKLSKRDFLGLLPSSSSTLVIGLLSSPIQLPNNT